MLLTQKHCSTSDRPKEQRNHLWRQCLNRLAQLGGWPVRYSSAGLRKQTGGHDSEKPAGESGARMARGIAAGVCLTHQRPSYAAGTESSRSFPLGPAAGILSSTIKIISGNDPQAGGDLRIPAGLGHLQ